MFNVFPYAGKSPGNMMINQAKGMQNFNKFRPPFRRGGRFEKVPQTSSECTVLPCKEIFIKAKLSNCLFLYSLVLPT